MQEDIKELTLEISAQIIKLAGQGNDIEENKKRVLDNIQNRKSICKISRTNRKSRRKNRRTRKRILW